MVNQDTDIIAYIVSEFKDTMICLLCTNVKNSHWYCNSVTATEPQLGIQQRRGFAVLWKAKGVEVSVKKKMFNPCMLTKAESSRKKRVQYKQFYTLTVYEMNS